MQIREIAKGFPNRERYALTSQITRSSRALSAAIAESYGKRKYPKHFISKLTDSDSENFETQSWLQFGEACGYIEKREFEQLINKSEEIGRLLNYMINNPEKFGAKSN